MALVRYVGALGLEAILYRAVGGGVFAFDWFWCSGLPMPALLPGSLQGTPLYCRSLFTRDYWRNKLGKYSSCESSLEWRVLSLLLKLGDTRRARLGRFSLMVRDHRSPGLAVCSLADFTRF